MIDAPKITELEAVRTAFIRITVPREKMPEVFQPAVEELVAVLAKQAIEIAGPLFAHHLDMSSGMFDFELGFPVAGAARPSGRVEPGARAATKVARTVYRGPYEGLPEAWGEFQGWVERSGLRWAPDIWEIYVTGPESEADPVNWRTELNRPLMD